MLDIDGFVTSPEFLSRIAGLIAAILSALLSGLFSGLLGGSAVGG